MKSYNGYTNYDTWNFVLWISSDDGAARAVVNYGRDIAKWTAKAAREIAIELVGDTTPDGAKAGRVNWAEVARHFKDWA